MPLMPAWPGMMGRNMASATTRATVDSNTPMTRAARKTVTRLRPSQGILRRMDLRSGPCTDSPSTATMRYMSSVASSTTTSMMSSEWIAPAAYLFVHYGDEVEVVLPGKGRALLLVGVGRDGDDVRVHDVGHWQAGTREGKLHDVDATDEPAALVDDGHDWRRFRRGAKAEDVECVAAVLPALANGASGSMTPPADSSGYSSRGTTASASTISSRVGLRRWSGMLWSTSARRRGRSRPARRRGVRCRAAPRPGLPRPE